MGLGSLLIACTALAQPQYDQEPFNYARTSADDPVARWQRKQAERPEPLEFDAELSYDLKTGTLTYTGSGKGEPETMKAGLKPSEIADAMARKFGLKLPIYN